MITRFFSTINEVRRNQHLSLVINHYKILLIFLILSIYSFSQNKLEFSHGGKKSKTIILVPFDKSMYFNDASELMTAKDKVSHEQIMEYFRFEINNQLSISLSDTCRVINMLTKNNTRDEQEALDSIFSTVSYEMAIARPNKNGNEKSQKLFKKKKKEDKNAETKNLPKTKIENGEIISVRSTTDNKYLKIVFSNKNILREIARKNQADYLLFINQFEIKCTAYHDPYLSGNKSATRTLKIHFSLFDYSGLEIHGGFAETQIPFHLNNKQEIVKTFLPDVVRQIISNF